MALDSFVMLPPEGKPLPGEPATTSGEAVAGLLSAIFSLGFIWLCVATYRALFQTVFGRPVYLVLLVAIALGACGTAFYILRDQKKSKAIAAAQVGIALIAGTVSTIGAERPELKLLAALAAIVVVANGVGKLAGS